MVRQLNGLFGGIFNLNVQLNILVVHSNYGNKSDIVHDSYNTDRKKKAPKENVVNSH